MNNELIKDCINLKLRLIDTVLDSLPEHARDCCREGVVSVMKSINEATAAYIAEKGVNKEDDGLIKVEIE